MDDISDIKKGDRIKVTFEANVTKVNPICFMPDGATLESRPNQATLDAPTFRIERIAAPIAIGDKVSLKCTEMYGAVLAIDKGRAWVDWEQPGYHPVFTLASLVRAS